MDRKTTPLSSTVTKMMAQSNRLHSRSRVRGVVAFARTIPCLFALLLTFVSGAAADDDAPEAVEPRAIAKSELASSEARPAPGEVASIDRRSIPARAQRGLPLVLYSAENELLEQRARSKPNRQRDHARRVAARYSIMALESVPRPTEPSRYGGASAAELAPAPGLIDQPAEFGMEAGPQLELRGINGGCRPEWGDCDSVSSTDGFFHGDMVGPVVRPLTPREMGMRRLVRKLGYRQARKLLRDELTERFESDPSFRWSDYQYERDQIWFLGRSENVSTSVEENVAEFRSGVLDDETELEEEIVLLDWGPFQVDDQGSLGIDVKKILRRSRPDLELAPEEEATDEPAGQSLFAGRTYRVDSDFRFTPHFGDLTSGRGRDFFGKVKAGVSVDFFDPLIKRKYLSTEIETWHKPNGESAVFMNFVIFGK
ncbi:MAG: hypothetical protein AAF488_12075 [Planctomycetota bacterium]